MNRWAGVFPEKEILRLYDGTLASARKRNYARQSEITLARSLREDSRCR